MITAILSNHDRIISWNFTVDGYVPNERTGIFISPALEIFRDLCADIIAKDGFTCVKCLFVINVIVSKVAFHTIFAIKIFKMLVEERFFFSRIDT